MSLDVATFSNRRIRIKIIVSYCSGGLLTVLGLMVIFGWFFGNVAIVRMAPKLPAMVFNTALNFTFIGIGFIFLNFRWTWVTRLVTSLSVILSFLTLMEYVYKINLGVDQLFFRYNLPSPMLYPGRPSMNTAIVQGLIALVLLNYTFAKHTIKSYVLTLIICFSLSFSVSSIFGYIIGVETSTDMTLFSRMALHTAIGCFIGSLTLFFFLVIDSYGTSYEQYLLPLALAFASLVAAIAVWQSIYNQNVIITRAEAQDESGDIQTLVDTLLREDVMALIRMAERYEVLSGYNDAMWQVDAGNYVNDLPGLLSIQIFNKQLQLVEKMGSQTTSPIRASPILIDTLRNYNSRDLVFYYDDKEFLLEVAIPMTQGFQGFLIASVDMQEAIELSMEGLSNPDYRIVITEESSVVYTHGTSVSKTEGPPIVTQLAEQYAPFEMALYVTNASITRNSRKLSVFVFISGILFSILVYIGAYFAIKSALNKKILDFANKDLVVANEKARLATQAKSAFLATMSHEIRTPLNAILGTIQIFAETKLDETQQKYVKRINFSSRALLNLINDILDFSKIEAGSLKFEKTPFDIVDLGQNVCESFAVKSAEKGVQLYLDAPEQPMRNLIGDGHRIEQIFVNLINNAFKFTEKGDITLKIEFRPKNDQEAQIHFEVIDTGIGVSAENQKKLFQKFSQVEVSNARKFGGVGLGLSICKGLIEKMNGQIGMHSQEGQGSTFWCDLNFQLATQEQPLQTYSLENVSVLLITPLEKERNILLKYLNNWKARVQTEYQEGQNPEIAIIASDQGEMIQKLKDKNIPTIYIEVPGTDIKQDLIARPCSPRILWEAVKLKRGK